MSYSLSRHLIALADDDVDDREIFSDVCADINHNLKVLLFENGLELINHLNRPDVEIPILLFLDINMPVKNGFETLSVLRESTKFENMCIVMYSTSIIRADVDRAKELGASVYLQKPYDFAKLNANIREILDTEWQTPCEQLAEEHFLIRA